jgi:hypothetical protein
MEYWPEKLGTVMIPKDVLTEFARELTESNLPLTGSVNFIRIGTEFTALLEVSPLDADVSTEAIVILKHNLNPWPCRVNTLSERGKEANTPTELREYLAEYTHSRGLMEHLAGIVRVSEMA